MVVRADQDDAIALGWDDALRKLELLEGIAGLAFGDGDRLCRHPEANQKFAADQPVRLFFSRISSRYEHHPRSPPAAVDGGRFHLALRQLAGQNDDCGRGREWLVDDQKGSEEA